MSNQLRLKHSFMVCTTIQHKSLATLRPTRPIRGIPLIGSSDTIAPAITCSFLFSHVASGRGKTVRNSLKSKWFIFHFVHGRASEENSKGRENNFNCHNKDAILKVLVTQHASWTAPNIKKITSKRSGVSQQGTKIHISTNKSSI